MKIEDRTTIDAQLVALGKAVDAFNIQTTDKAAEILKDAAWRFAKDETIETTTMLLASALMFTDYKASE